MTQAPGEVRPARTTPGPVRGTPPPAGRGGRFRAFLVRPETAVIVLAAVIFLWAVGRPSPWWDEAVTRDVVSRPGADILALVGNIDLVHAAYYLLVHVLIGPEPSFTAIRLLSVLAAAATAFLLVRIGRELDSVAVGTTAGILFAIAPLATRYAQEARPYAAVMCAATAATLALLRVCRRPWLPGRWVLYAALVVVTGVLNVLALLLVIVHLVHVVATAPAPVRRRWLVAVLAAGGLLTPLLAASAGQRDQVAWLPTPGPEQLTGFFDAQFHAGPLVAGLLLVAVLGLGAGTHRGALALGLAWSLLPPVLLWSVSQVHPLYDWRYVVFALPGTALALASLAGLLRLLPLAAVVAGLAVSGLHMQEVYRWPASGHAEDVRGAAEVIGRDARPGDAVLFLPSSRRVVALGFPEHFRQVDDVALSQDPVSSATLFGIEAPPAGIATALQGRERLWVVTGEPRFGEGPELLEQEKKRIIASRFRLVRAETKKRYEIRLYLRKG